jgi:hypothetical protein
VYDENRGCWAYDNGSASQCVVSTGGSGVYSLDLVDNTGDACDVTMRVVFRSMMAP